MLAEAASTVGSLESQSAAPKARKSQQASTGQGEGRTGAAKGGPGQDVSFDPSRHTMAKEPERRPSAEDSWEQQKPRKAKGGADQDVRFDPSRHTMAKEPERRPSAEDSWEQQKPRKAKGAKQAAEAPAQVGLPAVRVLGLLGQQSVLRMEPWAGLLGRLSAARGSWCMAQQCSPALAAANPAGYAGGRCRLFLACRRLSSKLEEGACRPHPLVQGHPASMGSACTAEIRTIDLTGPSAIVLGS